MSERTPTQEPKPSIPVPMPGYVRYEEAWFAQAESLRSAIPLVRSEIEDTSLRDRLRGPGPIFVGIGASLAAAAAPVWTMRSRGIHTWRLNAGEYPIPFPDSPHPVVGVSQSGKSTETLAVLASVGRDRRLAVVNVRPSPVTDVADQSISTGNIPDSYASTVGYTATLVALGMLAEVWDGGEVDRGWEVLPDLVTDVASRGDEVMQGLMTDITTISSADCVGAAPSVGSAEAGALLLREVARVPSTGMSTRQYLHGSMESAGLGLHVLFGEERERDVAFMLADAGHETILITSVDVERRARVTTLRLPALPPNQRAALEAVAMQALAGRLARARSLEPDDFVFHHSDTKVS